MIVDIEYQEYHGGKCEATKKIPDMEESKVEGYIKSMDCAVYKITSLKIRGK